MSSVVVMYIMIPILLILFLIPIFIGIYVFQDAKRRNMNAILWTVVAVLVPGLLGFLIYLLVRGNYSDLRCAQCDTPVNPDFVVCPNCGAKLKPACPSCGQAVEADWKVCPHCAHSLPEQQVVTPPVHTKDRMLWKILLVVFLVPLVLLCLIFLGNFIFTGVGGSSSFSEITREQYFKEQPVQQARDEVTNWLNTIDEKKDLDRAYVLHYAQKEADGVYQHYFLLYAPGTGGSTQTSLGQSTTLFGSTVKMQLEWTGRTDGFYNIMITSSKEKANLKVVRNGKKLPCDVTSVDFNPTVYLDTSNASHAAGDPHAESLFLPERVSIVKILDDVNVGVAEFTEWEQDDLLKLLAAIDSAPYLDLEDPIYHSGEDDFHDGYEILIEYRSHDDQVLQPDNISCFAVEQDGKYYLVEDRFDNGRYIRSIDKGTYAYLESRFASNNAVPAA